jgi:heme-degrading monooxygenase HmoA
MVLELAVIKIKAGESDAFEAALNQAQEVLKKADGYQGHEFKKCMEEANQYLLLIHWQSLEAHTEGFRKSTLFTEWRALIGPYFAEAPQVQHYKTL